MNTKQNDGGPAFPNVPSNPSYETWDEGMSLHDYFAAAALKGDWAAQSREAGMFANSLSDEFFLERAKLYSRMADAMLAEREKKTTTVSVDFLVNRFLSWPLPDSVCSDTCVCEKGYQNRTGTNLLTADEARQMFDYLLAEREKGCNET